MSAQSVDLKTYMYLLSTMTENRLNDLAMMYIHRDISYDSKTVVEVCSFSDDHEYISKQ